jgi:hypothetical protein
MVRGRRPQLVEMRPSPGGASAGVSPPHLRRGSSEGAPTRGGSRYDDLIALLIE